MLQPAVPTARTTARSTSHAGALRLSVLGLASALALSACNESQDKPPQAASAPLPTESAQPVATPVAYVPYRTAAAQAACARPAMATSKARPPW